jgi:hypothetical protein
MLDNKPNGFMVVYSVKLSIGGMALVSNRHPAATTFFNHAQAVYRTIETTKGG